MDTIRPNGSDGDPSAAELRNEAWANERVQRSEARLWAMIENIPVGVAVHREGVVRHANPALCALLGIDPASAVGVPVLDLVHVDDRARVEGQLGAELGDGLPGAPVEARFMRRDGGVAWVEITAIPFELDGEPSALAMVRDVGEQKGLAAQLVVADRLASVGRLTASVGHEINNPLAYILGNIQLLERDVRRAPDLRAETRAALLDRIAVLEEGAKRMRDTVRDLRAIAGSEPGSGPVEVCALLDVCANAAGHEIRHRARLVRDYQGTARVRAPEVQLRQVFLNLLVSAARALPDGEATEHEVRVSTRRIPGDRVVVEVSDTGEKDPGSPLPWTFAPLSAVEDDGGLGLGLSIARAIITGLGGAITVEPTVPRGTVIRVTLPCEPELGGEAVDVGARR